MGDRKDHDGAIIGSRTDEGELNSARAGEGGETGPDRDEREGLSAGDDSVDAAIGGGAAVSGSDGAMARSGRLTSEGTGTGGGAPDPGDPGGMGGVGAGSRTTDDRPPGGVSPIATEESESESEPPRRA